MIKLNCRNTDSMLVGIENGLNLQEEFENYREQIKNIITSLNQRKDKPGQWLQWMNLGYHEQTVWYVKEFMTNSLLTKEQGVWFLEKMKVNGGILHGSKSLCTISEQ